jgi:hypothetical protein
LQYYKRNCELSINELHVLIEIMDRSFAFRKRYCYMAYKDFRITNDMTLKKTIDSLVEKKLIFCKRTFKENGHRGMNEYKIMQPEVYINNFIFVSSNTSNKETVKTDTTEEEGENPWV